MNTENSVKLSAIVCAERNIPESMLLAKTRKREIVVARQIYIYILLTVFKLSFKQVAKITGLHRSTGHHCLKKVGDYIETDKKYKESFERIERKANQLRAQLNPPVLVAKTEPENIQLTDAARNLIQAMDQMKEALLCLHV